MLSQVGRSISGSWMAVMLNLGTHWRKFLHMEPSPCIPWNAYLGWSFKWIIHVLWKQRGEKNVISILNLRIVCVPVVLICFTWHIQPCDICWSRYFFIPQGPCWSQVLVRKSSRLRCHPLVRGCTAALSGIVIWLKRRMSVGTSYWKSLLVLACAKPSR